jgi:voltage-gated potassium channel|tara:strand:+ start:2256 stop:2564 length:309 start_codon:yes stop_codon:yes gene_type:complete
MLLLFLVIVIGVIGYTQIDNFGFIDSVYMTIITISTVGYGEVKDLSDGGKLFTSGLILASLIILGYTISILTQKLVHSQLSFFIQLKARKGDQEKWRIMLSL